MRSLGHFFSRTKSTPGQQLVVYQAEAGSRSMQALALLGSLAATHT